MANDINRVVLVGRLTRDPELKETSNGKIFCKFSIASNKTIWRQDQPAEDKVGFYECIAWGKTGEIIAKYCQKGKKIGIDGSLDFNQWENAEGKKMSRVEIYVDQFQFLDSKSSDQSSNNEDGYDDTRDQW